MKGSEVPPGEQQISRPLQTNQVSRCPQALERISHQRQIFSPSLGELEAARFAFEHHAKTRFQRVHLVADGALRLAVPDNAACSSARHEGLKEYC